MQYTYLVRVEDWSRGVDQEGSISLQLCLPSMVPRRGHTMIT